MIDDEKIIAFLKAKGPSLHVHIGKEFKLDTTMAGAVLSSLAAGGKVLISNLKVGGSPLYYLKEHEAKLQDFSKHLNEKDLKTYSLLKEKKLLRDIEMTPLIRVSLRQIKDFSKPLSVSVNGQTEVFWKWYLTPTEEADRIIRGYFSKSKGDSAKKEEPRKLKDAAAEPEKAEKPEVRAEPPKEPKEKKQEDKPAVAAEKKRQKRGDKTKLAADDDTSIIQARLDMVSGIEKTAGEAEINDKLHQKVVPILEKKQVVIKTAKIIKANSEIEYTISVPSALGAIPFYCRAKSKKKINDMDLGSAYLAGQMKKLPVLFMANGELSKKAKEMLNTDFQNMLFIKIS